MPAVPPSRARVLVVDDSPPALTALVDGLRDAGYGAEGFASSVAARDAIRTERFDAIVTDYQMVGGTGLDLLALARAVSPGTPVILYTGSVDARHLAAALDRGAFAVLEKPFPIADLVERLRAAMARI
jgi:DNA-binding NtrC family response regulator